MKTALKLFAIMGLLLLLFLVNVRNSETPPPEATRVDFSKVVAEVAALVKRDYVNEILPEEKFPAAYESLAQALDPLAAYIDKDSLALFSTLEKRGFSSRGLFGFMDRSRFLVASIRKNSPASRAGLERGDLIEAIDGKNLFSLSHWNTLLLLNPAPSAPLKLSLRKKGNLHPLTLALDNTPVEPEAAIAEISQNLFLLKLHCITENTLRQVESRLRQASGLQLIVDLTQTEGGNQESFLGFCRLLFPPYRGLSLKNKKGEAPLAIGSAKPLSYRAAVIVDESTIMYAELLAFLFQRHKTPLLGKPTRGFVSLLETFPLDDGSAWLMPVSRFLLDNKDLTGNGLTPDLLLPDEDLSQAVTKARSLLKAKK